MSNVSSLIQQYFEAFNKGDVESLLGTLHPQVQHDINEGGTEVGVEAFRNFKRHMDACYSEQIEDLVIMVNGNRGAAEFTVNGKYIKTDAPLPEATGKAYLIPAAAFFEEKDGKISRITSYYNLAGWIKAIS